MWSGPVAWRTLTDWAALVRPCCSGPCVYCSLARLYYLRLPRRTLPHLTGCTSPNMPGCTSPTCKAVLTKTCQIVLANTCQTALAHTCQAVLAKTCQAVLAQTCQAVLAKTCQAVLAQTCQAVLAKTCQAVLTNKCHAVPAHTSDRCWAVLAHMVKHRYFPYLWSSPGGNRVSFLLQKQIMCFTSRLASFQRKVFNTIYILHNRFILSQVVPNICNALNAMQ